MPRAIWDHDRGHTDSHIHTHTNKPPTAGVQIVGHTSITQKYAEYFPASGVETKNTPQTRKEGREGTCLFDINIKHNTEIYIGKIISGDSH